MIKNIPDKNSEVLPGTLYVVSTPIGNLGDLTIRAAGILQDVDLVAAEDTRRIRILLNHYGLTARTTPYHEHNARRVLPKLIGSLKAGGSLALVSDAGTPTLSDPGFRLVRQAVAEGLTVVPMPGVSAPLAALVAGGLPTDRFLFEGFLPRKKGRRKRIAELAELPFTLILFESPLRTGRTLAELAEVFGESRPAVLCRELTKKHEEFIRGTLGELARRFSQERPRGEVTLVIAGKGAKVGGGWERPESQNPVHP